MNKKVWIKFTAILGIMGFEAWFITEPSWEPAIGFLTSLFTYIITEIVSLQKYSSYDIGLFKKFLKEVPSDGYIEFFRTQDFAGSFLSQNLDGFNNFLREWNKLEVKFLNKSIQKDFDKFIKNCDRMQRLIGRYTGIHSGNIQRVIPNKNKQLTKQLKERYNSEIKKLNDCADELYKTYEDFINKYQKKINVNDGNL